jgi:Ca2+/Na+ antiporter
MGGNFTPLENVTDLVTLTQQVNFVSGNILGDIMVLVTFVVMFAVMKRFENSHAFTVASFITMIIAILLKQLNIVHDAVLILTIVVAAIMMLITFMKSD